MLTIYTKARTFAEALREEAGQDLIEYALIGALVAVVVAAALPGLTDAIKGTFTTIEGKL